MSDTHPETRASDIPKVGISLAHLSALQETFIVSMHQTARLAQGTEGSPELVQSWTVIRSPNVWSQHAS